MLEKLSFKIAGISPLIQHNGQLADPGNEFSLGIKEISAKRKKVMADYVEMARLEFLGGLYLMNKEPCIPGRVFEGCLVGKGGSARKERAGKIAQIGIYVLENFPLIYDGPRDPFEMWQMHVNGDSSFVDQQIVPVGQSRILRTRPIFTNWAANVTMEVDTEFVDLETAKRWVEVAGQQVGLMDYRPKYGRFAVAWNGHPV